MAKREDPVYHFASLSEYSFKERFLIHVADLLFSSVIKLIGKTVRFEVEGIEHLESAKEAGMLPIYSFWHDRTFLSAYFWRDRGIVVLTSRSLDGEYIARVLQRFGCGAIRGSSSRGGSKALVEMIKVMRRGLPTAFTVDGPRGPKYEVKPGPVFLAKKTGNPILPFVIEPHKFWTTNGWDKMHVPRPFTRAAVLVGDPIYVDAKANETEIDAKLAELQRSLDRLVERGRQWSGRER